MSFPRIHYIYHSCFFLEFEEILLIFDFFKFPKEKELFCKNIIDNYKNNNKKVIIFSSHSHNDHFNSEIFNWSLNSKNFSYILSDDISNLISKSDTSNIFFMKENEYLNFSNDFDIYSFGSTDLGISFLLKYQNFIFFHAGDLNWWNWGKEDTFEEAIFMENNFKNIILDIKKCSEKIGIINVAFFPIDPRLEERCFLGAKYFIDKITPNFLIPMHFYENFDFILKIKKEFLNNKTKILEIENAFFELSLTK